MNDSAAENSARHPASHQHWTTDANEAAMFLSRESAEKYIYEELTHPIRGASARAVEHGFMTRVSMREVAYADAEYVLRWLRQVDAPPNIVALQERATAYLGVASGR